MALRIIQTSVLLILVVLTAGCASRLKLTYTSDPQGAVLHIRDKNFGYTPVTLRYPLNKEDRDRGSVLLPGASVRWASGASAEVNTMRADLSDGLNQVFTFIRPEGFPGRGEDFRFALDLERNAIMRRQAQAQEEENLRQQIKEGMDQANRLPTSSSVFSEPRPRRSTNCTSRVVGNTIRTTCD